MEYLPYILIGLAAVIGIIQWIAIRRYRSSIDQLKIEIIEQSEEKFKAQTEEAKLKGANDIKDKSLEDQASYINDLINRQ